MSKQTKLLMLCLAAVCTISIVCNMAQYATRPDTAELDKQVAELQQKDSISADSIKQLNDSIAKVNASLTQINAIVNKPNEPNNKNKK